MQRAVRVAKCDPRQHLVAVALDEAWGEPTALVPAAVLLAVAVTVGTGVGGWRGDVVSAGGVAWRGVAWRGVTSCRTKTRDAARRVAPS